MSKLYANWTIVEADPDLAGYTQDLLDKMSVQLRRAERDDPTTVVVLVASIFVLVFSVCFAGATCALRCCLRRWTRLLDEPPPSAEDGRMRAAADDDDADPDDDADDADDAARGRARGRARVDEEQPDRARGLEID